MLEATLQALRAKGRHLLVPYLMAGLDPDWLSYVDLVIERGADAVEIGIPFSDPSMDGPVIQRAGEMALARGVTPLSVLAELGSRSFPVPLIVMTYYNIFHHMGEERAVRQLRSAGVQGVIIPDLPLEEGGRWRDLATKEQLDTVQLVSPATPDERIDEILAVAQGFVYGVGLMGVTGERAELAATATTMATRMRPRTSLPVLIGIGISSGDQAAAVIRAGADGVVVGSALLRRVLDNQSPRQIALFIDELRGALDTTEP
ncbi:tryptophan synthase subunit alpha [Ferrimicrobium sp.]|uniref:tryptophan synthase subunit alpha n=1 Tax=Ferrimicrobium sp. TaxID=2926050 RepID=UPI0026366599|nr:tryptophan synthase subunit alpha [Ferrimicrobium sp.]